VRTVPGNQGYPPPILRALEGIAEGSGRTIVIAGPEASGKSALLEQVADAFRARGISVTVLRGQYRDRTTPFALVRPLTTDRPSTTERPAPEDDDNDDDGPADASVPLAGLAFDAADLPASRRGRGERQRGKILGMNFAVRTRGVDPVDPSSVWGTWQRELRAPDAVGRAVVVDDAVFADDESRDLLAFLADRAAFVPLVFVLALDESNAAFAGWEERLRQTSTVEWIRLPATQIDPREASRVHDLLDRVRPETRRLLAQISLMGGTATEVQLARVSRLTFPELADALLPATEARLVRIEPGRVVIPHHPWIEFLPQLLEADEIRTLHREIAEALEALNPEPSRARRREFARHFFEWQPNAVALRHLVAAVRESIQEFEFDEADGFLAQAFACVPALPAGERNTTLVELHLLRAEVLLMSGRPSEAALELAEWGELVVHLQLAPDRLIDALEPVVPALIDSGPRPAIMNELYELAERLHAADQPAVEALLAWTLTELERSRGRAGRVRHEAHRAGHLARREASPVLQAIALAAVGSWRTFGDPTDAARGERFLHSAELGFDSLRLPVLEHLTANARARSAAGRGDPDGALAIHHRAIPTLQGMKLPAVELAHELAVAEIGLDRGGDPHTHRALARARELVDLLELTPPSTAVLRLWLAEGRAAAAAGERDRARDRWTAVADRPGGTVAAELRGDALLRLSALDLVDGLPDDARSRFERPETLRSFPGERPAFEDWAARIGSVDEPANVPAARAARLTAP